MPPRLAELLERIRPAGAPGAPSEGDQQREQFDRAREIAEIAAALAVFEQEADGLIAAATTTATELGRDAEGQVRRIRTAVPDRIAAVQATAVGGHQRQDEDERTEVRDQTAAEVARLETRAARLTPLLVAAATDAIWAIVTAEGPLSSEDQR